ncbi:MAG: hypothetical protein ACSHX3_02590 [Litorimonas sp.]
MTKTLLSGVAAIAFAFAAPSAFAQNSNVDPDIDAKMKTEQMIEEAEKAADDLEETTDELADTSEDMWDTEKSEAHETGETVDEDVDTTVDDEGYVTPSVDCPEGTTIQPDGTCMAVGDWKPDQ